MNVERMEDKKEERKENGVKFDYFKTIGRIGLIFFIGFSVYFFISTLTLIFLTQPEKEVKLPYVVGKQFVEVYNSLSRKGLKAEIKFYDVFDIENGIILNQNPESGSIVTEGNKIRLVVSRSTLLIDVPNLVGIELPFALNKLKNLHIYNKKVSIGTGVISYIPSEKSADNIVVDQSPRAGEKITPDMKINLLVSSGKIEADQKMPDIAGQSVDLCYNLLLSKGLVINQDIVKIKKQERSGVIISQNPLKNAAVKKGQEVRIKVGYFQLRDHPYQAYEMVQYKISSGELAGLYEGYIEDNSPRRLRFSKNMKPGERVRFLFHRHGNARITILCNKKIVKVMGIEVDEFE